MKLRRAASAATAAALLALTACGTSEDLAEGSDDPGAQTGSGSEPEAEPEAQPESEPEVQSAALTQESFSQVVTDAQLEAGTATFEATLGMSGEQVQLSGEMETGESLDDSAMSMQMEAPGMGDIDMILVDGTMYMNLGKLSNGKYAATDLDDPQGLGAMLGGLDQLNFAEQTKALEGAIEDFETGGTETIDGVETTEYVLTVDVATLNEQMEGPLGDMDMGAAGLPDTLEYAFWVGEDGLPRRLTMDLGAAGTVEMEMSGWGEPVDIEAPAPNEISRTDPFSMSG